LSFFLVSREYHPVIVEKTYRLSWKWISSIHYIVTVHLPLA
jgi:hypothetical protein